MPLLLPLWLVLLLLVLAPSPPPAQWVSLAMPRALELASPLEQRRCARSYAWRSAQLLMKTVHHLSLNTCCLPELRGHSSQA